MKWAYHRVSNDVKVAHEEMDPVHFAHFERHALVRFDKVVEAKVDQQK